jgi:DNA-binding MarR family transcriptional regulator
MRDSTVKRKSSSPSRRELLERLSLAIRSSQNVSEAFDEHVAAQVGINRTDLRCLDILEQRGPLTAGRLATAMHLSSGAITTLVDRLERAGFAQRRRDTEDRRRVLVELVPGRVERAFPYYEPLYHGTVRLLESHSNEEIELMIDFLEKGREMVEQELARLEQAEPKPEVA